jgi:membrane protease YdiL (CAAX protease family)
MQTKANEQTALSKILSFFLTKIMAGIAIVGGSVAFTEWFCRSFLDKTRLDDYSKNIIMAFLDAAAALSSYTLLFRAYEKRQIKELSWSLFAKNALVGFSIGFTLQSLFVLILYLAGDYSFQGINPISSLILPFTTSFTAGFVAETLIIGVFFRVIEESLGTMIALFIITLLFGLLHINMKGATILSVLSTAMQAGFLVSAAYVWARNLWIVIFLHFAWDFTEPGIFGAINPGNSIDQSLFVSKITGSAFLTGGQTGPQNSIQSLVLCSITGVIFLWLAKRKKTFL